MVLVLPGLQEIERANMLGFGGSWTLQDEITLHHHECGGLFADLPWYLDFTLIGLGRKYQMGEAPGGRE